MEITRLRTDAGFVVALTGRLDATWADAVERALAEAVRGGEHRLVLDLAGVDYISSAGLRVVINALKQLRAVRGAFALSNAQPGVRKVIELSGLHALLAAEPANAAPAAGEAFATASAAWERFGVVTPVTLRAAGAPTAFVPGAGEVVEFSAVRFGLGVGAFAASAEEAAPRLGEFLAVAGCAAHLPPGEGHRTDFVLAAGDLVPTAWLASGLVAEGEPGLLLRFEATCQAGRVSLREIARTVLDAAGGDTAAFVLAAETAGLVGASLRRSPAAGGDPFAFPGVRDWLNFTTERAYRDTTAVVMGVVARPDTAFASHIRPIEPDLFLHAHAAVFPYRPIRKGAVALGETVRALFEGEGLQTLLHLLRDPREPDGAGDSEFLRGAAWVAPIKS